MKVLAILALTSLLLIATVRSAVISLEEGDDSLKRIMKVAMDPIEDPLPLPRFEIQDGEDAEFIKYALLGTLDCSPYDENDVVMAIYDLTLGEWTCSLTSALPNDEEVPTGQIEGLEFECEEPGRVATWFRSTASWSCSGAKPLLDQAEPNRQSACRTGDVLTVNLDFDGRPAALCDFPGDRQVGDNAIVSLKKRSKPRNPGDPDFIYYVQSTSKAIGNLAVGSSSSLNHFLWNYWKWSPVKTSFSAAMGSFPPILPVDTAEFVALSVATYRDTFTAVSLSLSLETVLVTPGPTSYDVVTWTGPHTVNTSPAIFLADDPAPTMSFGQAVSIQLLSVDPSLTGNARDAWIAVSIWVSYVQIEE